MGKRKLKTVFWVFLLLIVTGLIGCKQKEPEKEQLCHIVMEKGDGYQVTDSVRTIKSGSDVSCMHSGRRGQTRQILYTKKYQALQS